MTRERLSSDDLAVLIAATAAGDRAAFRRLYDLTAAKLLPVALRMLRDRQAAEDVVQDAYVKIWRNAASYSPDAGRPMTWLITVTRNRALDVLRARRDSVGVTEDAAVQLARRDDGQDHATAFADADQLSRCLSRLEPAQRDCFLRAYLDGASREELAVAFDRPVNTIKSWLHRSGLLLKTCLEET